jgi:hypothetical protein
MGIADLLRQLENSASGQLTAREYQVRLTLRDAARIAALVEMYPRRGETELISELLTATLDDLEKSMPYIPGNQVISEDEEGDPIYEDVGPTPRFLELSRKYLHELESLDHRETPHKDG